MRRCEQKFSSGKLNISTPKGFRGCESQARDGTGVEKENKKYTEKLKYTSSKGRVTYFGLRGIEYMTQFEKCKRSVSQLAGTNHRETG